MDVAWSMSTVEANDHAWRCDCLTLNQLRPYSPRPDTIFSFWPCSCRRAQAELVEQQSRATPQAVQLAMRMHRTSTPVRWEGASRLRFPARSRRFLYEFR